MATAIAAPRLCTHQGCGELVYGGSLCPAHSIQRKRSVDARRGSATERGYDHRWRIAVQLWRAEDPERNLCVDCRAAGRLVYGRQTDHVLPHKGDMTLFWHRENWQALCDMHHSSKTSTEDGGYGNAKSNGINRDGVV